MNLIQYLKTRLWRMNYFRQKWNSIWVKHQLNLLLELFQCIIWWIFYIWKQLMKFSKKFISFELNKTLKFFVWRRYLKYQVIGFLVIGHQRSSFLGSRKVTLLMLYLFFCITTKINSTIKLTPKTFVEHIQEIKFPRKFFVDHENKLLMYVLPLGHS